MISCEFLERFASNVLPGGIFFKLNVLIYHNFMSGCCKALQIMVYYRQLIKKGRSFDGGVERKICNSRQKIIAPDR